MTGAAFELVWDDEPLRQAARRLMTFGDAYAHRMWDAIGHSLVSYAQMRFEEQVDPQGTPWKKSQRAIREGGQTLYDKGFLFASETYNVINNAGVEQGSNRVYAAAIQFGADITSYERGQQIYRNTNKAGELKPGFVKKSKANYANWVVVPEHKIHIDARPYLGLSEANAVEIVAIAQRHENAALLGDRP
jgi:phage gpG-like protein